MSRCLVSAGVIVWLAANACSPRPADPAAPALDFAAIQVVDLSHEFGSDTIYWPTATPFALETVFAGVTELGFFYTANRFSAAEHGGTHLDAPIHFGEGRHRVHEIPIERLIGAAVVVDVVEACRRDAGYAIAVGDLAGWETEHGPFPEDAIVLFKTGFSLRWPDRARYLGTAALGEDAVPHLRFPGLAAGTARWLVARGVRAIGIDTASIDPGASRRFESHQVLAAANVPTFENLTRLEQLPARGFAVIALPMKIRGGSGAPLRAVALLPK
jgi:kynurenine formamidase